MIKDTLAGAIAVLIGMYMIAAHFGAGLMVPPVLSGVAFVVLGGRHLIK